MLTGFLGSGRTTLLKRMLSENHGKRIAVIENKFGEVGGDNELVIGAEEEIIEMNNGCICCTVRGDLIRILGNLMKRRDRFDYILIETTGLADRDPWPRRSSWTTRSGRGSAWTASSRWWTPNTSFSTWTTIPQSRSRSTRF